MNLPETIEQLLCQLEQAGFAAYAVGGCVRDAALGLQPHDYDLCTSARPEEIQTVFSSMPMFLTGVKHGTVSLVTTLGVVEVTTFRTEGGYEDNRHPDWVQFLPEITGDLARRDFTINAMAYSPSRGFQDPFGGRADLEHGILRAVGQPEARFQEDALRILRGARFAARFRLTPEPATFQAMVKLRGLLDQLALERVFCELDGFLRSARVEDLLRFAPLVTQVIPELAPAIHFDQRSPHHALDLYRHIAHVTAALPATPALRWAGLLHDVGKPAAFTLDENGRGHFYGHAQIGADLAEKILRRLHAPNVLRERVVWLIGHHMSLLEPDEPKLRKQLSRWGEETVWELLDLEEADFGGKGTGNSQEGERFQQIRQMLVQIQQEHPVMKREQMAIRGGDLLAMGCPPGPMLGRILQTLLDQVLEGRLPNCRQPLLDAAARLISQDESCLATLDKNRRCLGRTME